ncbi:hypothetical protein MTO96_011562 [Rhipicephalus appendiculatus]
MQGTAGRQTSRPREWVFFFARLLHVRLLGPARRDAERMIPNTRSSTTTTGPFGPALAGGSRRMHPRVAAERNTAGTPPYKRRLFGVLLPARPTATSRRHAHGAAALNDVLMRSPVHCDGARRVPTPAKTTWRHENYKARVSSSSCVGPPQTSRASAVSGGNGGQYRRRLYRAQQGCPTVQATGVDLKGFQPDSVLGGVDAEPTKASLLPRDNAACSRRMHAPPSWAQRADGKGVGSRFSDWNA